MKWAFSHLAGKALAEEVREGILAPADGRHLRLRFEIAEALMPVYLRPDELENQAEPQVSSRDDDAESGFGPALAMSARAGLVWMVLGGGLMLIVLEAMKKSLVA